MGFELIRKEVRMKLYTCDVCRFHISVFENEFPRNWVIINQKFFCPQCMYKMAKEYLKIIESNIVI